MKQHIIETVIFQLKDQVSSEQFLTYAQESNHAVEAFPGFVARRLSHTADGTWYEHVEWESLQHAKAAAAEFENIEAFKPLMGCINPETVVISHSELAISVN